MDEQGNKTECLLVEILKQLRELNNRVVSRTNSNVIITHNTATTKKIVMTDIFGEGAKANDLSIISLGGGFTISVNGESHITATLDLSYEDEDIYEVELAGTDVGTAVIRFGAYIPKYR